MTLEIEGRGAKSIGVGETGLVPTKDLVGTFDPVEDIASVATVEEQDEFMRRLGGVQKALFLPMILGR